MGFLYCIVTHLDYNIKSCFDKEILNLGLGPILKMGPGLITRYLDCQDLVFCLTHVRSLGRIYLLV